MRCPSAKLFVGVAIWMIWMNELSSALSTTQSIAMKQLIGREKLIGIPWYETKAFGSTENN
ncbi:unnamed protein product [Penicillium roqueforti FM164]|uniref:Genomic scaffold, ProqFM164S01 n=1 Tax=Penicillium roqueforti (strain FM164) TaxID=1365484 RepID=W6PQG4_PENRF|nr:unnamed protein product [Penicillium roqueforti FM164]